MTQRRPSQLSLFKPQRRKRAVVAARRGRKPRADRIGMLRHAARPAHEARHPLHVTMRRVRLAPSFRTQRVHAAIVGQIAAAVARGVRVVEYSVQHDHLHFLVEAADKKELAKHLKLLFSRIAFGVNAVAGRHGALFSDRHHRRELGTPTEVRRVLVCLFFNTRKHDIQHNRASNATFALDAMTSAPWFGGWDPIVRPSDEAFEHARAHYPSGPPTCPPGTWLSASGWRRAGGLIRFNELPRLS